MAVSIRLVATGISPNPSPPPTSHAYGVCTSTAPSRRFGTPYWLVPLTPSLSAPCGCTLPAPLSPLPFPPPQYATKAESVMKRIVFANLHLWTSSATILPAETAASTKRTPTQDRIQNVWAESSAALFIAAKTALRQKAVSLRMNIQLLLHLHEREVLEVDFVDGRLSGRLQMQAD